MLTKNKFLEVFIFRTQGPGFSTNGDGLFPLIPATVTKEGVLDGLNNTFEMKKKKKLKDN